MTLCRLARPLLLAALVWALPTPVGAGTNTWTSNGPAGHWIRALAQAPGAVYAGAQTGGMFRSTDGGASWSPIDTGLTGTQVRAVAVDPVTPTTVYCGTTDAGVFRSVDGGDTWTAVNTGLTTTAVLELAIDPQAPGTIYAGTNGGGVFKSVNGGDAWTASNNGSLATIVQEITLDPSDSSVVYLGSQASGTFKSVDGGLNWTQLATIPENVLAIAVDPSTPATLYLGAESDGVFKSTNGGLTLIQSNTGLDATPTSVRALAFDPGTSAVLYAATAADGVFVSLNGGLSWAAQNTGLTTSSLGTVHIDPLAPTMLYAGTLGGGVFAYELAGCDDGGQPVTCGPCETCSPAFGCVGDVWLGCRVSTHLRKAKLTLKNKDPDLRDRMVWTWSRGEETQVEAFGDPLDSTVYEACIFDESSGPPALDMHAEVVPALICNGKPCWKHIGDRAFKYRNADGVPNGATKLILKSGIDGKAKIIMKAKGELLQMPSFPLGLPFRFQLRNDLGECWEAVYTEAGMRKNDDSGFTGKNGP